MISCPDHGGRNISTCMSVLRTSIPGASSCGCPVVCPLRVSPRAAPCGGTRSPRSGGSRSFRKCPPCCWLASSRRPRTRCGRTVVCLWSSSGGCPSWGASSCGGPSQCRRPVVVRSAARGRPPDAALPRSSYWGVVLLWWSIASGRRPAIVLLRLSSRGRPVVYLRSSSCDCPPRAVPLRSSPGGCPPRAAPVRPSILRRFVET
jgi:hypothetical protein